MIRLQKLLQLFSRLILPLFFKIEIKNQERARIVARPLIILANHKSDADHLILAASLPKNTSLFPIRPIAKAPLFEHLRGLNGKFLEALGAIPHTKTLRTIKILKNGGIILIYPEGGIRKSPGIHDLEDGTAFLAIKTHAWILPIAISGLDDFPLSFLLNPINIFRKRRVTVSFGEPFLGRVFKNTTDLTSAIKTRLENLYKPTTA